MFTSNTSDMSSRLKKSTITLLRRHAVSLVDVRHGDGVRENLMKAHSTLAKRDDDVGVDQADFLQEHRQVKLEFFRGGRSVVWRPSPDNIAAQSKTGTLTCELLLSCCIH